MSISGDLQATLCVDADFRGCTTLTRSARQLDRSLDRDITSYSISGGRGGQGGGYGGGPGN